VALAALPALAAESDLPRLERAVGETVSLRQAAHEAEVAWAEQRPAVEARLALLQQQRTLADEQLRAARQSAATALASRQRLEADVAQSGDALLALAAPLRQAEERLRRLAPRLPEPLSRSLAERLKALPPAPAEITVETLAERLKLVFGLLAEIDQFAHGVVLTRQTLAASSGVVREMDVLYLGLGAAFAVSSTGDLAAVGIPGENGWQWRWEPALAPDLSAAVAIYRKDRPAAFVNLPLELAPKLGGAPP
jgi:uncharacterized protein (DUF1778 family)